MAISFFGSKNREINKVVLLPVDNIVKNPSQPRKYFNPDELQELARSIAANGLLQPIIVRKIGEQYELVAGERRTMAFRSLGRQDIPAIVQEFTNDESAVMSLIENLQRKDLNFFEEAMGISRLMEMLSLNQNQISTRLGKAQSTVANKLRLLKYPLDMQERMIDACLTERHARALLRLPEEAMQRKALEMVIEKKMTVKQTEQLVEIMLGKKDKKNGTRLFVVKDMRIFLNSINKAVAVMNHAGIPVDTVKNDSGEYLEYTIKIPKQAVYKQSQPAANKPVEQVI